jgi:hypothetical protein
MPKYKSKRALSEEDDSEDLKSSKKIKPSDSVPASKSSSSKSSGAGAGKDSEGNPYWEVGRSAGSCDDRRATLTYCSSCLLNAASASQNSKTPF